MKTVFFYKTVSQINSGIFLDKDAFIKYPTKARFLTAGVGFVICGHELKS